MALPTIFDRARFANILGMLVASTSDTEKLAALGRANAIMSEAGVTWRDLALSTPATPAEKLAKSERAGADRRARQRAQAEAAERKNAAHAQWARDDARKRPKDAPRGYQSDDPLWNKNRSD